MMLFDRCTVEQCDMACGGRAMATELDTDAPADTMFLVCQEPSVITAFAIFRALRLHVRCNRALWR